MNKIEIILNSIESLGYGNTEGQIFLVDDIWPQYLNAKESQQTRDMLNFFIDHYLKRTEIELNNFYLTCAYKSWMITEDEHLEALKTEIENINPRIIVSLGRRASKYLLKIKDSMRNIGWFESIHSYHYVKRFFDEDKFYIESLNSINRKLNNYGKKTLYR